MDRLIMFVLDFSPGWYTLLAFSIILFAVFSYMRKSFSDVIKFGSIGLLISIITEVIGIGFGLWSYAGGNWPVILWPTYFIFLAAFYQVIKVFEKKKK